MLEHCTYTGISFWLTCSFVLQLVRPYDICARNSSKGQDGVKYQDASVTLAIYIVNINMEANTVQAGKGWKSSATVFELKFRCEDLCTTYVFSNSKSYLL